MRTQRAHRLARARGLLAGATLVPAALLLDVASAAAQAEGASSGDGRGLPAGLLFGGAALLLLAAALVGYGVPARRRRGAPEPAGAGAGDTPRPPADLGDEPASWRLPERSTTGAMERPADSPNPTHTGREQALGYTTFPDRRRAVSPEGRYQARRIEAACEARGMVLHQLVGDVHSYSGPDLERPGLRHAFELLAAGEVSCLVVAGLDRLSRSAGNLGTVIEWLEELDARLIVIDIDLDTHTEQGRVAARALSRVGAIERRGREQLAPTPQASRPQRQGGRRPAVADLPLLQRRIATMRASGMTLQAIADTLNSEGIPTLRGGAKWRPSSVQAATGYKRPGRHTADHAPAEHDLGD